MATRSVPQPPFSAELLADLHADNIDPDLAARLWPVVRADADAAGYLRDLDEVTARVRALGTDDRIVHRMPGDVADRLAAFLDGVGGSGEAAADGPTERLPDVSRPHPLGNGVARPISRVRAHPVAGAPTTLRPRRSPTVRWAAAAAAAVAVLAGAGIGLRILDTGTGSPPTAQPTPTADPGQELDATAALAALGRHEVSGPLGDTATLQSCVRAAGVDRPVLGAMNFTYRGSEAVLILVAGPRTPKITALVVGPGCGADDPQVLEVTDIG
ncbi:hypothetical protein [Nocardia shimofusensis]|uniref:hypothetical protein n=1 Tax=Nocardia shimofusensis TaxID=228596 RepID=UPI000832F912|nr:hypothetical protein [Nocardia shimofusensis]